MKNLAFHRLLRWKIIIPQILTTSLIHFSLRGWESVLFELGTERVKNVSRTYSPNKSTAVTETQMAVTGSEMRSMKIGMASTAAALANSSVTSSKWCLSTSGRIFPACSCSWGLPPRCRTFRLRISRESRPMVRPDIKPARQGRIKQFTHGGSPTLTNGRDVRLGGGIRHWAHVKLEAKSVQLECYEKNHSWCFEFRGLGVERWGASTPSPQPPAQLSVSFPAEKNWKRIFFTNWSFQRTKNFHKNMTFAKFLNNAFPIRQAPLSAMKINEN